MLHGALRNLKSITSSGLSGSRTFSGRVRRAIYESILPYSLAGSSTRPRAVTARGGGGDGGDGAGGGVDVGEGGVGVGGDSLPALASDRPTGGGGMGTRGISGDLFSG